MPADKDGSGERAPATTGRRFESLAESFLTGRGLSTVTRNYTCRAGEIDLVMRDRDTLVFVEVRYRRSASHGGAAASITPDKRKKLIRAARYYLMKRCATSEPECRFDVVAIQGSSAKPEIDWIAGAFSA